MKKALLVILIAATPVFARVDAYGPRRVTRVGHGDFRGRGDEHVIDRRGGPGWGGVAAAGILGAVAGAALGAAFGSPPVAGPPVVGEMVAGLPGACVTVPSYTGAYLYDCGNIYYQPVYEGPSLMYQVVPAP